MDSNQQQQVRERAYQIWESEGRPEGREIEHWLDAERLVLTEANAGIPLSADEPKPNAG